MHLRTAIQSDSTWEVPWWTLSSGFFGENTKVQDTCPQLNAMVTISEANAKYVNYKEPLTYRQALRLPDAAEWQEATDKALKQFIDLKAIIPMKEEDIPEGKIITVKVSV